jgi:hypothetical protein
MYDVALAFHAAFVFGVANTGLNSDLGYPEKKNSGLGRHLDLMVYDYFIFF